MNLKKGILFLTLLLIYYISLTSIEAKQIVKNTKGISSDYQIIKDLSNNTQNQLKILVKSGLNEIQVRIIIQKVIKKYVHHKWFLIQVYDKKIITDKTYKRTDAYTKTQMKQIEQEIKTEREHYIMSVARTPLSGNKIEWKWMPMKTNTRQGPPVYLKLKPGKPNETPVKKSQMPKN